MNIADELEYIANAAESAEGLAQGYDARFFNALKIAEPILRLVAEAIRGGKIGEIKKVDDIAPLFAGAKAELDELEAKKFQK